MKAQVGKYSMVPETVEQVSTKHRRIVTKLPVPESLAYFEMMDKYEPVSMQGQPPVLIDRSEGCYVYDKYGNKWLDWSSGVLISNIGNGNKVIIDALQKMLGKPLLSTYVFPHEGRTQLAKLLCELFPFDGYKAYFLATGSEATENCIKLAKTYGLKKYGKDKKYFISFKNAFHGRTMGAQLAGGMDGQKAWLGKLDETFIQVPFPDGYKCEDTRFELFLEVLKRHGVEPEQVCGVMSESFQGVGPDSFPLDYIKKLEKWCKSNDVLLIMDEVQAGFCRSGKWFMFEHYGIQPDIVACGKGISSSLPLSAVIGREDVMNMYGAGSMTSTHSGSPLPVAAAIANILELQRGPYLSNAQRLEPILRQGLERIQKKHPEHAGCVHCIGLVAGIQIVKPGTRIPDPDTAIAINERCYKKGLLMFAPVGIAGECIKVSPALDIPEDALLEGIQVLDAAMDEVLG